MQAGAAHAAPAAHAAKPASFPATGDITLTSPCQVTLPGTTVPVQDTCTVAVTSVQAVSGALTATGTVTGTTFGTQQFTAPLQVTGTCQILDLTLGPLHLDLLGLVVDLNQVHLTITAEQGPGNLLGNLLCAVAGLLDPNGPNPLQQALQQIVNLLNQILAAL
jgi:hypothetical protein